MELLFNGLKANQVTGEVKLAFEKWEHEYCLGVILPNGDPWVFWDKESKDDPEVLENTKAFFSSATVTQVTIKEHNKLKKEYEVKRYATK